MEQLFRELISDICIIDSSISRTSKYKSNEFYLGDPWVWISHGDPQQAYISPKCPRVEPRVEHRNPE